MTTTTTSNSAGDPAALVTGIRGYDPVATAGDFQFEPSETQPAILMGEQGIALDGGGINLARMGFPGGQPERSLPWARFLDPARAKGKPGSRVTNQRESGSSGKAVMKTEVLLVSLHNHLAWFFLSPFRSRSAVRR